MTAAPRALLPELARLDRLIACEIERLRAAYEISLDEFRGLYISDEQVDALVRERHGAPDRAGEAPPPLIAGDPWALLIERFRLGSIERDVLLIAVASELDRKYETLFAYLNNEVGRRWPTSDLVGRLIGDPHAARRVLASGSVLLRSGLLEPLPESIRRTEAMREFAAAPPVAHFLHGLDPATGPELRLHPPPPGGDTGPLANLARLAELPRAPLVALEAQPGSGRLAAARRFGATLGRPVLEVDLAAARPAPTLLREAGLVARLADAILFVRGLDDASLADPAIQRRLAAELDALPGLVLTALSGGGSTGALAFCPVLRIPWPEPDEAARRRLWADSLFANGVGAEPATLDALADRFRLTPAQIGRAAHIASVTHKLQRAGDALLPTDALFRAAREQSSDALDRLAVRVARRVVWGDLVLPPATLARLREVALAIANRGLVQHKWGMGRLSLSPDGLAVLFQGASGTGKTMAAGVIAGELGLDLYRIELAAVVSKYIGETEKNIDRIFRAARRGNAILLFDEADALFGKRSDVKDAHDRYANLEVAYLLQRMEEHDGPVILATNLAKNIDQAFSRRLNYVVEFPRPNQPARATLWRQMLAPPLPCAADVDPDQLARTFELTGGEIRKAALEAAFLAAADGCIVTMAQLLEVSGREVQRQGRMASAHPLRPPMLLTRAAL
jgi:hypothetical protein